jgi:tetraacyldisaccharide 4'-kinase
MTGTAKDPFSILLRLLLIFPALLYGLITWIRNLVWNFRRPMRLPGLVISIGNITVGGTGKSPMVAYLADRLELRNQHPAVLLRGYKRKAGQLADEQIMLGSMLNLPGHTRVPIEANPDRSAGARRVLEHHPLTNLFILDDGFQHRRVHRDLDIVLIDATCPLGHGWILPRGLLREPVGGLSRAGAIAITRCNLAAEEALNDLEARLKKKNPRAPIYRVSNAITSLIMPNGARRALQSLENRKYYAIAGIANPLALQKQLCELPGECVGQQWYADHYDYTDQDLQRIGEHAVELGAQSLLVTEKDFAKLRALDLDAFPLQIYRLEQTLDFADKGGDRLIEQILQIVQHAQSPVVHTPAEV